MKTKALILSAGLLAGAASSALADKATLNGGPGYGGGAFTATIQIEAGSPFGGPIGSSVQQKTFCIEATSYFSPGTQYFVEYSNSATPGGGGASGGQDPISSATAWLFSRAVLGALALNSSSSVMFDINNASHNKAVQAAIWSLEGETNPFSLNANETAWRNYLVANAGSFATAAGGGFFGVQVMRLWDTRVGGPGNYSYSGDHQDQLVLVPLPQAAWAGIGMMGGVVGMAYVRRRKQQG